ncbi:MAG: VOC family protein [Cytophagaceae bacterium]|nr:VOC family protein [Gemmatimonadaceae bacterium]
MFDGPVEEAAKFYISVFPNSEIKSAIRCRPTASCRPCSR